MVHNSLQLLTEIEVVVLQIKPLLYVFLLKGILEYFPRSW